MAAVDRLPAEVIAVEPGITERVAVWTASLRYEDIPEPVLVRARLQMASVLGAMMATSRGELHPHLVRAASRWGRGDQASIIPSGPRSPLHAACYVKPQREKNKREHRRVNWWLHAETCSGMREALKSGRLDSPKPP